MSIYPCVPAAHEFQCPSRLWSSSEGIFHAPRVTEALRQPPHPLHNTWCSSFVFSSSPLCHLQVCLPPREHNTFSVIIQQCTDGGDCYLNMQGIPISAQTGTVNRSTECNPFFLFFFFFFFFSFFFFIFSIFFFFLWKRWKDTFILVSNEVCGVGVWAYAHLHASVPECVPCVCECEDVNVACCVIIIAFLTTHVQLLSWPAGVTVWLKDRGRVRKDRRTLD